MKDSSHWYARSGAACHEQPNKSKPGTMRATTLTDARKQGLIPSVSTQFSVLSKPQLEDWKLEQMSGAFRRFCKASSAQPLMDMLSLDEDAFHAQMLNEAFRQVEQAADAGEQIHAAADKAFRHLDYDEDEAVFLPELQATYPMKVFIHPVVRFMLDNEIEVTATEKAVVSLDDGYAGRLDIAHRSNRGFGIGDMKTRKTKPGKPAVSYFEQQMQIAAYHRAHYGTKPQPSEMIAGFNLYISTTEPGRVEPVWHDAPTIANAYQAFTHVCALWRHTKGYDCRTWQEKAA